MKKLIFILLFPIFTFSQDCYTVKDIVSTAEIEEISQKRVVFGIKQMTEEILSEKYEICQEGIPVSVDVISIEAPSKGMSLGPFAKNKKQTIVKVKINVGGKESYGEGLAEVSSQSLFLDLNDDTLPFSKTSFASAMKKALESILN
jgi:hypothetical protein